MTFTLAELKAVLEDEDTSVGHVLQKTLLRNEDNTYVMDENDNYVWGKSEPAPFEGDWWDMDGLDIVINGKTYTVKELETTGGMDEGSHASVTFELGGRFFQKNGYYASHYGTDWDGDFFEVEPYSKLVTDYRPLR